METKLPEGYTIIPGVRQDHLQRDYVVARNEKTGKSIMLQVQPCELNAKSKMLLESVTVHSLAYTHALTLDPENEKQEKIKAAIIARGPTYQSITLYQIRDYWRYRND
jgi:hypothetical protein